MTPLAYGLEQGDLRRKDCKLAQLDSGVGRTPPGLHAKRRGSQKLEAGGITMKSVSDVSLFYFSMSGFFYTFYFFCLLAFGLSQ